MIYVLAVAGLRKDGLGPHLVVDTEGNKPTEEQVVFELLSQQPFTVDRVERLDQQGSQQTLGWNRWAPHMGVDRIQVVRHVRRRLVDPLSDLAKRMAPRNPLFE